MPAVLTNTDDFSKRLESMLKKPERRRPVAPPEQVASKAETPRTSPVDCGAGPLGGGNYVVRPGECTSSIAKDTGHFWETLWNDPANETLRTARKDPNVLLAGDRMHVMPLRSKTEMRPTGARHRFVRRGEPAFLRLTLMEDDQPRANQRFVIEIDGTVIEGTTDPEGNLAVPIPGDAKQGVLRIGPEGQEQEFPLNLGQVDPLSELSGVQGRLNNIGFGCGPADGVLGPQTRSAIGRFQAANDLPVTSQPDDATRAKLLEKHGS